MQGITDKLQSLASQAGEGIGQAGTMVKDKASQLGDALQANPTLAAMLLAGGGAGLLGGYLTSQQEGEEGESKGTRRSRILRNALLSAGAGAGAVGLGAAGLKKLNTAVPGDTKNPVQEKLTSPTMRVIGAGAGGIYGTNKGRALDLQDFKNQAMRTLTKNEATSLSGADPETLIAYAQKNKGFKPQSSDILTQNMAKIKSPQLRKVIEAIVGTTRAGQMGRAGAGLGLMLPEVIGQAKDLLLDN